MTNIVSIVHNAYIDKENSYLEYSKNPHTRTFICQAFASKFLNSGSKNFQHNNSVDSRKVLKKRGSCMLDLCCRILNINNYLI